MSYFVVLCRTGWPSSGCRRSRDWCYFCSEKKNGREQVLSISHPAGKATKIKHVVVNCTWGDANWWVRRGIRWSRVGRVKSRWVDCRSGSDGSCKGYRRGCRNTSRLDRSFICRPERRRGTGPEHPGWNCYFLSLRPLTSLSPRLETESWVPVTSAAWWDAQASLFRALGQAA